LANLEFHRAGNDVDEIARKIVRYLEDRKIARLTRPPRFLWNWISSLAEDGSSPIKLWLKRLAQVAWAFIVA
jgi:hypothetical protein